MNFGSFPLLAIAVVVYLLVAVGVGLLGGDGATTAGALKVELFGFQLPSGVAWNLTFGDLLLIFGLTVLSIEMARATKFDSTAMYNHMFSVAVMLFAMVLFVVVPAAGTSVFFLILTMTVIDVVAGFIISLNTAKRDVAGTFIGPGPGGN